MLTISVATFHPSVPHDSRHWEPPHTPTPAPLPLRLMTRRLSTRTLWPPPPVRPTTAPWPLSCLSGSRCAHLAGRSYAPWCPLVVLVCLLSLARPRSRGCDGPPLPRRRRTESGKRGSPTRCSATSRASPAALWPGGGQPVRNFTPL